MVICISIQITSLTNNPITHPKAIIATADHEEVSDEVRADHFVTGFSGEQFALPKMAALLRHPLVDDPSVSISAIDPLHFHGILIPDERVAAMAKKRINKGSGDGAITSG